MKKALMINCGNALILNNKPGIFEGFDAGMLNCGSMFITPQMQQVLSEHRFSINAGSIKVVDIAGEPVDLGTAAVLDGAASFDGRFLVAEQSLVITETGAQSLKGIAGIMVAGTLYCPRSLDTSLLGRVYAEKEVRYPEGAVVSLEELALDRMAAERMEPGRLYAVYNKVTALDSDALETLKEKSIRLECGRLVTFSSLAAAYRELLAHRESTLIPDGFEITEENVLSPVTRIVYGDRVYFPDGMSISKSDAGCLEDFSAIVVAGTASLPVEAVPAFKRIGKAGKIFAYEGNLLTIKGNQQIDREYLRALIGEGIGYTLNIDGVLRVGEDVEPEDLSCIKAIYYDGVINAKNSLLPLLEHRVKSGNGIMTPLDVKGGADDSSGIPGVAPEDVSKINIGTYKLI